MRALSLLPLVACGLPAHETATPALTAQGPVELGRVAWLDDLDRGLATARDLERPVFLLFQEVPGCSTCKDFGAGPLSHPLFVEAIEELFVPVAVHNNRPGKDAEVLSRYDEPAWNNPVVRFLDEQGEDLLPRADRVWSTPALAGRALAALEEHGDAPPAWLETVALEQGPELARATFAMPCFWSGEAALGAVRGVASTRAGWLGGREVVEVRYDPGTVSYAELVAAAEGSSCASRVFAASAEELATARSRVGERAVLDDGDARDAKQSDRKYYLRRSSLRFLPLTAVQRTKVNAALGRGQDASPWLSPRQRAAAERLLELERSAPSRLEDLEAPRGATSRASDWEALLSELERRTAG